MKYDLIIGLPARNEEKTIYGALESISEAISGINNYKIVVCTNSCTDDTAGVVKEFINNHRDLNCVLIKSQPGLVNAQRKIVDLFPAKIYVFPDADSKIEKDSIKALLNELNKNNQTVVAYAKTVSLINRKKKLPLAERMGILYDSQKLLSPRKYIHGRLFATKDWSIPSNQELSKAANRNRSSREMLKYCKKGIFLSVDDIFLSSYIMDKYGLKAIKQVDSARCFAWSIASFSDWLRVYRRRNVEMEKMKRWFPEYNYLWPHLNRRTNWRNWLKADWRDKMIWLMYLSMKGIFFCYLRFEFLMLKVGLYHPPVQWKAAQTTKKSIKS